MSACTLRDDPPGGGDGARRALDRSELSLVAEAAEIIERLGSGA